MEQNKDKNKAVKRFKAYVKNIQYKSNDLIDD